MTPDHRPDPPIHQSDPDAAPDTDFAPGNLRHLVPGNRGRMLDPRRTPVAVRAVDPATATFELEVLAFEDAGARWVIEAERIGHFQFARDAAEADPDTLTAFHQGIERFDRPLRIAVDPEARARTLHRLRDEERSAGTVVGARPSLDLGGRSGDQAIQATLLEYLGERGLGDLESAFTERYASNPSSGDLVKGHRIVVAQLGLVAYDGQVPRDPAIFAGPWDAERRAAHILTRLGFVRALFRAAGHERVWLYRGLSSESSLGPRSAPTFVSTTFDRAVAESISDRGPATVVTALYGQLVPIERLFMTYIETAALDRIYHEAEAVLLAEDGNRVF